MPELYIDQMLERPTPDYVPPLRLPDSRLHAQFLAGMSSEAHKLTSIEPFFRQLELQRHYPDQNDNQDTSVTSLEVGWRTDLERFLVDKKRKQNFPIGT